MTTAYSGMRLSAIESSAIRRLSLKSRTLLLDELQEPDSRETVRWILRQNDPERVFADAVAENVRQATDAVVSGSSGVFNRNFSKKLPRLYRSLCVRIKKTAESIQKNPETRLFPSHLGGGSNQIAGQAWLAAMKTMMSTPQQWDPRGARGQLDFMDMVRSLTSDPAIIAQALVLKQRDLNAQAAGSDNDRNPVLEEERALVSKLQQDKNDATAAAAKAQGVSVSVARGSIFTDAYQKELERAKAEQKEAALDPAGAQAKVDAAAAAALAVKTAKAAETKIMEDKAHEYAVARNEAYEQDILARISRGEVVARAEYVKVYYRLKNTGGHPYVEWTNYEAQNGRQHSSWFSKLLGPVVSVIGGILAPFTGGASVIAASLIVGASRVVSAAQASSAAASQNTQASQAQQAAAAQQAADLKKQVDDFFNSNKPWFAQHGVTPELWAKMTLDQKVEVIRAGAAGESIKDPQTGQVLQQAVQTGARTAPPLPPYAPTAASQPASSPIPAPSFDTSGIVAGGVPNVPGVFRLEVEGRVTRDSIGALQDVSRIAEQATSPGDRFEIFESGRSLGLKIRTTDGSIAVPDDQVMKVRSMSHDDILKLLSSASDKAASSSGNSGLLLLLALPAVAFVASKK